MSDLPIKATFKSGAGYDAPWLTIDANDPDDLTFKLDAILGGEALTKVIAVADLFKAANNAGAVTSPAPQQAAPQQPTGWGQQPAQQPQWSQPQQQAAPVQQGARLHPEGKTCNCGQVLQYKTVNRKSDGKQFSFWECPARTGSKDVNHDSEFAN